VPEKPPEALLVGSDRPRPLPPALRARLEKALLARPAGAAAPAGEAGLAGPGEKHARGEGHPGKGYARGERHAGAGEGHPGNGYAGEPHLSGPLGEGPSTGLPAAARGRLARRLAARRQLRKWGTLAALGATAAVVVAVVTVAAPTTPGRHVAAPSHQSAVRSGNRPVQKPLRFGIVGGAAKGRPTFGSAPRHAAEPVASPAREPAAKAASGAHNAPGTPTPRAGVGAPPASASAAQTVVSVTPREGPTRGGNWVVVKGNGVGSAPVVYFGQARALRVVRVSAGEVRALAPAHAAGTVTVSVGAQVHNRGVQAGAPEAGAPAGAGADQRARYTFVS
jgi:hypothetical protein